ncbi:hypothetical protein N2152v2_000390 [Parachlorella kessleri]
MEQDEGHVVPPPQFVSPALVQQVLAAMQAAGMVAPAPLPAAVVAPAAFEPPPSLIKPSTPPTFSGDAEEDVDSWLWQVECWLTAGRVQQEAERVLLATGLLRGAALAWWRSIALQPGPPASWEQLQQQLKLNFQPINQVETMRDRLAALRQTDSVMDYTTDFRNIAFGIPGITDDELRHRFVFGLEERTRSEVRMRAPDTFEAAVRMAVRYDSMKRALGQQQNSAALQPSTPSPAVAQPAVLAPVNDPVPMDIEGVLNAIVTALSRFQLSSSSGSSSKSSKAAKQRQKLTPALRKQLTAAGRCWKCRQTGHRGRECPERR